MKKIVQVISTPSPEDILQNRGLFEVEVMSQDKKGSRCVCHLSPRNYRRQQLREMILTAPTTTAIEELEQLAYEEGSDSGYEDGCGESESV